MAKKLKVNGGGVTLSFEDQIWEAACEMWGHIPAADYRKVIIGLIFLRYVDVTFRKQYEKLRAEGLGFEETRDAYTADSIFYIPPKARWAELVKVTHSGQVGSKIDAMMLEIEKENPQLKGVLPKIYGGSDIDPRVLGNVVDIFTNKIHLEDISEAQDILGRTYEYCIAHFAAYEGVKGGEFYTPGSIVKTLVAVLKPSANDRLYDPCCGSCGMFAQSKKFILAHSGRRSSPNVYGQEANADTWKMAKMNMAIRGIFADLGEHHADTFHEDLHKDKQFDKIMANPPFNLSNWGQSKLKDDYRWAYGVPPDENANYAWIQHMISHLSPKGQLGLVLANGALTVDKKGQDEIRKNIIDADLVEGIVSLPDKLFFATPIPVSLWFISRDKKQKDKTLFIDAREMGHMVDRKHRELSDEDVEKLAATFESFRSGEKVDEKGFAAVATTEEIAKQDYMLTPGRYVGIEEEQGDDEPIKEKMTRLKSELEAMFEESHRLEKEIKKKLAGLKF